MITRALRLDRDGNPIADDDTILKDGERIRVPIPFMDAFGRPSGFAPGYIFHTDQDLNDAAHASWIDYGTRTAAAWRNPPQPDLSPTRGNARDLADRDPGKGTVSPSRERATHDPPGRGSRSRLRPKALATRPSLGSSGGSVPRRIGGQRPRR